MENIQDILNKIKHHNKEEQNCNARNRAIGRGFIAIQNRKKDPLTQVWITNREFQRSSVDTYNIVGQIGHPLHTGIIDTYTKDGPVTSKNSYWGRILLENYSGTHYCITPKGKINFEILNSSTFNSGSTDVTNLKIGISSINGYRNFRNLNEAFKGIETDLEKLKQKEEEQEESKRYEAQLKLEQERKAKELEAALQKAKDKEEALRLEEQHRKEEEERLAKIHQEEERQKLLELERQACEQHLNDLMEKYRYAVSFIRTQASLRLNPILDKLQNDIKFSHIYDGTALVIDGGPGTGKTTTLIQRLKLLINEYDLKDYLLNHNDCMLTNEQITIATAPDRNWIFFSPTELLRQYLKDNMNYEGLSDTENKTCVWENFLRKSLRDNYKLFGEDQPFDFRNKKFNDTVLLKKEHLKIVKSFTSYYIKNIKKKLLAIEEIDCSKFSWSHIGLIIQSTCKKAENITDLSSLCRLLFSLRDLKEQKMPEGRLDVNGIVSEYTEKMRISSTSYIARWQKNKILYDDLLSLIASWNEPDNDTEEENENEDEDEILPNDYEIKLNQVLRRLLRKLALSNIDSKVQIRGRSALLYAKVKDDINVDELSQLGEYAFFMQYIHPVINNYETTLFSSIHTIYKNYRKDRLKKGDILWNLPLLSDIVEKNKNRLLHPQEQSLLIGFINNLILCVYKTSASRFNGLKHKYAIAYKELCRPVIGIDEATDYSLIDYYAIASLRHYKLSSFTMTGDLMQCLKINGISDWEELKNELIFPNIKVKELRVSYRQSPELLQLAKKLYFHTMKKDPPYQCYLSEEKNTPRPLWKKNDDEYGKAEWIVSRILEVQKAYGMVPSVAIFVTSREEAAGLKETIEEIGRLETAGIDIKDCSEGDNLSSNDTVRIFPVELVKGMEFEVVFFHNIHSISSILIDKYLYVGLSRATFFMGVTSNKEYSYFNNELESCFDTNGNWSSIQANNS